jgi:hypothetical protein
VLPFLEPPILVNLTIDYLEFNGNLVDAWLGLKHPFKGADQFTGFDVCGVLITNGSAIGFTDAALRMPGPADTRLLNPDGYTRWWNPAEFPHDGSIWGYKDGFLGIPDSQAHYNSTINAYKLFCDDITDPTAPLSSVPAESRCVFAAGTKNVRHYNIELGADALTFNYAIDACWHFPSGTPPWNVPDDFPPKANRQEAWNAVVAVIKNTLWNDGIDSGGELSLELEIWDHFNAEVNQVYIESPGNFDAIGPLTLTGADPYSATYVVDITSVTPAEGSIQLLIIAESEYTGYQGLLPGKPITAYFTHDVIVDNEPPNPSLKNIPLREGFDAMDIAVDHADGDLLILYSDGAIWRYTEAGNYQDGNQLCLTYEPGIQFMDIAPNSNIGVAGFWMNEADKLKVYDPDGNLINNVNIDSGACWAHDVTGFTGHTYTNMIGLLSSTCPLGSHLRWRFYEPPAFTAYWYANLLDNACGASKIHRDTVMGTEAGNIDMWYVYYLEGAVPGCDEYRVQRLYRATGTDIVNDLSVSWGGMHSDDMVEGFWDPQDITRDADNDFYILDILSTGDPAIKKYAEDGAPIGEPFGDTATISGTPLRIEGSDYTGPQGNLLFVLHDGSPGDMLSVFFPSEIPD